MSFLFEKLTWDQANVIVERDQSVDGKPKKLFMKGIFIQGAARNHNQRVYPVNEIRRAVNQLNDCINKGETVWGEADHPETLTINIDRISHMITEIHMEGNDGVGKLQIIDTPMGNICRTLIEAGGKLGVSSRGSGNVNESNGEVSDFDIVTIDLVCRPSAPNALPDPIYERRMYDIYNSKRGTVVEDLAVAMKYDPKAQKFLRTEIIDWINNLK